MYLNNSLSHGQPQAQTVKFRGKKRVEDERKVFRLDPFSLILNPDQYLIFDNITGYRYLTLIGAGLQTILDNAPQGLLDKCQINIKGFSR